MSAPSWTRTAPYPWRYGGGGVIEDANGDFSIYLAGRLNNGNADDIGHLVAVAPELYSGLLEFLDAIESELIASASSHCGRDDEEFREEFPEDYERCKRLRALLAKARGETP